VLNNPGLIPWLWLSLASSLLLGLYEVSRKAALSTSAPLLVLLSANLGALVSLGLALLVSRNMDLARHTEFYLVPLNSAQHGAVLIKSLLVSTSWMMSYSAVKHLPITVAGPLRAVAPAFTVLGALFWFHEAPSLVQWSGIAIIFAGYFGFARLGRSEGISYTKSPYVILLVAGTIVGAMSGLLDKHLLQRVHLQPTTLQFWFVVDTALIQVLLQLMLMAKRSEPSKRFDLGAWKVSWLGPLAGALLVVADQFYFRALAQQGAMVSVVSMVRRSSVLVSFSVGAWLFREQLIQKKALALLVVLTGLLVLITGK